MKLFEMFGDQEMPIEDMIKTGPSKIIKDEMGMYEFDLAEDLVFFMHNNDDFYRSHFFPILKTCKAQFESGGTFSHRVFKKVIEKAYESYKKEFPIKELEDNLEEEFTEQVAHHIYETELQNMKDGLYK
jgi:hypothetical protein